VIKRSRTSKRRQTPTISYRTNRRIRVREVRLVDQDSNNRGVVPIDEALQIAEDAQLDLVEVAPNASPPVCRIMDYSKFSYEQQKKAREARKRQKTIEVKTIRMRVKTDDYHKDISVNKARGWLEEGKKVQVTIRFYGRERDYPELGRQRLEGIAQDLKELSTVEQGPNMEGWTMNMMLAPVGESGQG